jgi:ubiquinone/menaquinone biosynthesis C-methylase UbiE
MQTATVFTQPTSRPRAVEILEAQRNSWNAFSPGWAKWDAFTMQFLDNQRTAIVDALAVGERDEILDIATGTGEPGLTLAGLAPRGRVTALDASSGMLRVAQDKARARSLPNFVALEGDACALPFADDSFDAISCRLGFMFFPDMRTAASEMLRVLRPGGVLATTVWAGPSHNEWITTLVSALKRHVDMPAPPPGAPGMFRCADLEAFSEMVSSVGFRVESQTLHESSMRCTADEYWGFMNAVVAPVVAALRTADEATVAAVKSDVYAALATRSSGDELRLGAGSLCIVAHK